MELNRKQFVGTAGLALAGTALASVTTAVAEELPVWSYEADVVILGSGCAGMYGACLAADEGMSVILLEKQPEETAGGDTRCCYASLTPSSTDPELLLGCYSMYGDCDEEWAYKIQDAAAEAVEWLADEGCSFIDDNPDGMVDGSGPALYAALRDAMYSRDIEVMYETPAKSLIQNADHEVVGVVAGTEGELNIKAKKGVLIATGAYTCNKQLISDLHFPGVDMVSLSSPYLTGDGLIMACDLGAKISKVAMGLEFHDYSAKVASAEVGTGIIMIKPGNSVIYVNGQGKRFQDEFMSLVHTKTTMPVLNFSGSLTEARMNAAHYDNLPMWEVFDQSFFNCGSVGNGFCPAMTWAKCIPSEGYDWSMDNQAELEKGWLIKADTLEELAEKMSVDAAALQETVATYNAGCEAGQDAFGRNPEKLAPIVEAPFYAVELAVSLLYTIGGLTTDVAGRTLNWSNQPIPRLYSAGNVGNVGSYLAPIAVRGNMAQSAIAVEDIAQLTCWDEN